MRLYDSYGRLVIAYSMDFDLLDTRYIRKDTSDTISGAAYIFDNVAANMRIKNGKVQIKSPQTGLFHSFQMVEEGGVRYPVFNDVGES